MPITWGTSDVAEPEISGYDIKQFAKFFTNHNLEFSLTFAGGSWTVDTWESDFSHFTGTGETLGEALLNCYRKIMQVTR